MKQAVVLVAVLVVGVFDLQPSSAGTVVGPAKPGFALSALGVGVPDGAELDDDLVVVVAANPSDDPFKPITNDEKIALGGLAGMIVAGAYVWFMSGRVSRQNDDCNQKDRS